MYRFKRLKHWLIKELPKQKECIIEILNYLKLLIKSIFTIILHPSGIKEGLAIVEDCLIGIIVTLYIFIKNIFRVIWWIFYYSLIGFKGG